MKSVYLAGPITGLSYNGAVNWREHARIILDHAGIEGISPMRAKDYLLEELSIEDRYEQHILSTAKGITHRDRWDCSRCDIVLANFVGADRISIGTVIECGWADAWRKPLVLAMEDGNIHHHAMLDEMCGWRVPSLEEALNVVKALCA